ncbi:MAG: hypothetical protein M1831_003215 [Alyxoria varia]|nr:MAG: hypothetical protein M1831_003215 [Alyxoria varia]
MSANTFYTSVSPDANTRKVANPKSLGTFPLFVLITAPNIIFYGWAFEALKQKRERLAIAQKARTAAQNHNAAVRGARSTPSNGRATIAAVVDTTVAAAAAIEPSPSPSQVSPNAGSASSRFPGLPPEGHDKAETTPELTPGQRSVARKEEAQEESPHSKSTKEGIRFGNHPTGHQSTQDQAEDAVEHRRRERKHEKPGLEQGKPDEQNLYDTHTPKMSTRSSTATIEIGEGELPMVDALQGRIDGPVDPELTIFGFPRTSHVRRQFGRQPKTPDNGNASLSEGRTLNRKGRERSSLGGDDTQDEQSGRRRSRLARMRKVPPSSMQDEGHQIASPEAPSLSSVEQDELLLRNCGYSSTTGDETPLSATGNLSPKQRVALFAAQQNDRRRQRHPKSIDNLRKHHHLGLDSFQGSVESLSRRDRASFDFHPNTNIDSSSSPSLPSPVRQVLREDHSARSGARWVCQKQGQLVCPRCLEPLADPRDARHGPGLCAQAMSPRKPNRADRTPLPLRLKTSFVSLMADRGSHSDRASNKDERWPDWVYNPGGRTRHLRGSGVYERAEMVGHGSTGESGEAAAGGGETRKWKFEEVREMVDGMSSGGGDKSDGRVLIDVREPHEFKAGHIPHAINVPISSQPESLLLSPEEFEDRFEFGRPDSGAEEG